MNQMLPAMPQKEYLISGLVVVGIVVIRSIVNLFATPSLDKATKKSIQPLPQMGEDDKLTIWGYEGAGKYAAFSTGMSDSSYYVSRVEAYCRAAQIPYIKLASKGGSENPRGKVPFANIHGTMRDDSANIISSIEHKYNKSLDQDLTPHQLATGHLVRETLHGSLYWVAAYLMFQTEEGRKVFRSELAHELPPVVLDIVYGLAIRAMYNNLYGHGIGRMPETVVVEKGRADLNALSIILGQHSCLLGTTSPTSFDCDVYAMLAIFFGHEFYAKLPWVVEARKDHSNLYSFFHRMKDLLYPELKEKSA